jgi:putative phosphoribosyl transferase
MAIDIRTGIHLQWNCDGDSLGATLHWPDPVHGVVVFAHGSGSSRLSPRNRLVAQGLHEAGLATVLLDLLTHQAAARPKAIQAVVSRGGRPDLAFETLPQVRCPTLLIVGGKIATFWPSTSRPSPP